MKACGAPVEGEVDEEVKNHVDHALNNHNSSTNDEKLVLVKITKVLKQVVAGIKYTVDLVAEGETSKKQFSCKAVLVSQAWVKPEPDVISFTVSPL